LRIRVTIFAVEEQLHILYCASAALVIAHAKRMRHISSVACPSLSYFSTLSQKRHDFRGKKVLNIKCVFWFIYNFFETFLILRRIQLDIIISVYSLHWKYPLFLTDFFKKLCFLERFLKNSHIKFHENPPSGMRFVPCRQTDRHNEANSSFSQFCERA